VSRGEVRDPLLKHLDPEQLEKVTTDKHFLNPAGGYSREAGKAQLADESRYDKEDYFLGNETKRVNNQRGNQNIRI